MPRRGKGKKRGQDVLASAERAARRRSIDTEKANYWQDRLRAGILAKTEFTSTAREVDNYFKSKHASLFDSSSVRDYFMEFDGSAAVSVPIAAKIRSALGPHLYPLNPKRNVNPKGEDKVFLGLSRVLSAYINRTPREGKLAREFRKDIDDSLLRGRGFMRTGYDTMQGIVTSWYVSSKNVLIDPDVDSWEDAEWIAIRQVLPLWRAKRQIKDKWRKKNLKGNYRSLISGGEDGDASKDTDRTKGAALTNDLLEFYEIYSKMGAGQLGHDFPDNYKEGDNDFVKITVSLTHEVPLGESEWEAPLYLDKDWLLEPIDFVETLDELWPESTMGQILPLQKGIDLLTSLALNSCKMRGKFVMLGDADLPASAQKQIKYGTPSEYIPIKMKVGDDIRKKFMALPMGAAPAEIAEERAFLERQIEATTGLTSAVTGAPEGQAKDRSATASRLRGQATNARLGDMRARVEEQATNVARHEALMVRLELDADELDGYVTTDDIGLFMVAITPSDQFTTLYGLGEIPVRDTRSEEERRSDTEGNVLTLEQIAPSASTFFDDPNQAGEACMKAIEGLIGLAEVSPLAFELLRDLGIEGPESLIVTDEMGNQTLQLPKGVQPRPVKVEDVWSATAGVTAEELCRELSYEIATGSMQKFDKSREIETAELAMQNVMPAAINNMDYELVNAIFHRIDEAHEIPVDRRLPPLQPPPPPPPAEGAPQ